MRRLTNMKKSRSPPPTSSFLIDNPVFEDSGTSPVVQVAHARYVIILNFISLMCH